MSETARECALRLHKLGLDGSEIIQHRDFIAAFEREYNLREVCAMAPYAEDE